MSLTLPQHLWPVNLLNIHLPTLHNHQLIPLPPLHHRHHLQPRNTTPAKHYHTLQPLTAQLLIAGDIVGTTLHPGTNLPRLIMATILPIEKDVLEIIIVKAPPVTTTRDVTHTDITGESYILAEHI
jgi:hypothetical protein